VNLYLDLPSADLGSLQAAVALLDGTSSTATTCQQTDEDERIDRQAVRERVDLRVDRSADVVAADHVIDVMTNRHEHGERDEAVEGSHRDVRSAMNRGRL
jgi:hypothetical protein